MTQALRTERIDPLRQALEALGRRRRGVRYGARLLLSLRWALLVALGVLLVDAAFGLPDEARLAALVGLIMWLPAALWWHRPRREDRWRGALGDARRLETSHGLADNPLVNALQLGPMAEAGDDALARALAQRSRERGRTTLGRVDEEAVVDRAALRRQGGYVWAAVVAWLVVGAIHPPLVTQGLARLLVPFGLTPPASLTQFDVTVSPDEPYEGQDVSVTAELTGQPHDAAAMVEVDEQGNELRRWPMGTAQQGRFVRTLRAVREPVRFRIEAGGAASGIFTITPQPRPAPPAPPPAPAPATQPDAAATQPQSAEPDLAAYLAEHEPELSERLAQLGAQAEALRQMADELATADPQTVDWAQWQAKLRAMERELADFQRDARALAGDVRDAAERAPQPFPPQMQRLADALDQLSLCQMGACPNPGAAPSARPGMGRGIGTGGGMGGGGLMLGPAGFWAAGVRDAALADLARMLSPLAGARLSPVGGSGPRDADATTPGGGGDPGVGGAYHETLHSEDATLAPTDALMQQVPPDYRDLVGAYFDRLNADDDVGTPRRSPGGATP